MAQSSVGAFNRFLRENGGTPEERELLAAKLVGRWRSGMSLTLAPERDDPAIGADPQRNNAFDYTNDAHGYRVPFGAHMRRMNPRDTKLAQLTDVNLHRIVRRSTTYRAPYDPRAVSERDDEVPRGIYFIALSAKAMGALKLVGAAGRGTLFARTSCRRPTRGGAQKRRFVMLGAQGGC